MTTTIYSSESERVKAESKDMKEVSLPEVYALQDAIADAIHKHYNKNKSVTVGFYDDESRVVEFSVKVKLNKEDYNIIAS